MVRCLKELTLLCLASVIFACTLPAKSETLIGSWSTDEQRGQLGVSRSLLCFHRDGQLDSILESQAGRIATTGSYSVLKENTLRINIPESPESPQTVVARIDGDRLILTTTDGESMIYRRINRSCE
jgi:hypothetical protein